MMLTSIYKMKMEVNIMNNKIMRRAIRKVKELSLYALSLVSVMMFLKSLVEWMTVVQ